MWRFLFEGEGDDGLAAEAGGFFEGGEEAGFFVVGVGDEFAGGDLFLGGAVEAEFADAESFSGADGRAEDAAGHGAGFVELAESGGGVKDGAGLVVGEAGEGGLRGFVFVENSGAGIAGKIFGEAGGGVLCAAADSGGAFGVTLREFVESALEPKRVELIDGEDADATLRASRAAGEPLAALAGDVGESGVDDLDEAVIGGDA